MSGEVFGEADVILRARLDRLQQDMDQAERMVVAQSERLQVAHNETALSARRAAREGEEGLGILAKIGTAVGAWKLLGVTVKGAGAALASIPAIAVAAKAALVGLVVGGVLLVGNAIDAVVGTVDRARRAIGESIEAAKNLDGTTGRVLELAQALEKIPVVGRSAGFAFRVFSGDAEVADAALIGLIGTVEDGEVKLGGFARFLARGVGLGHMVRDIDRVNEKLREFNSLNAMSAERAQRTAASGQAFGAITESSSDDARLAGLEGVERVRAMNAIAHREAMQQLDDQKRGHLDALEQRMRFIREQRDAEEISAGIARQLLERGAHERAQLEADHAATVKQVNRDMKIAGDERIRQAERLVQIENRRLAAAARSSEMAAGGDTLGSQLVMIEHRRQEAIRAALESGHRQQLNSIQRFFNAQERLARDAAQQAADAERDRQQRRLRTMQEAMQREREMRQRDRERQAERAEDLTLSAQAELAAVNFRNQGQDFDAQRVEMEDRFRQRIDEAVKTTDKELLDTLFELRDARRQQIDILENESKMREQEELMRSGSIATARQVDAALTFLGGNGGGDPKKEEKEMVDEQKRTNELLEEGQVARAG